jgi:membrane protein
MSERGSPGGILRLRELATRLAARVGGVPAVLALRAVLREYDAAGGGLVASGLAYAALVALLPGLLLVVSVVALIVGDPAVRDRLVVAIGEAVPPLEGLSRSALDQVTGGAVPTGIVAILGLLWGSSRFYAALDGAFARIFRNAPRRNILQQSARGLAATGLFVMLPVAALFTGSVVSWAIDAAPAGAELSDVLRQVWRVASPVGSIALFVVGTAVVYRFVPARRLATRDFVPPALVVGVVMAAFTQVFTFVAPRLLGVAALYGAVVTAFALLAWLSFEFNFLLLGAAWTRVRAVGRAGGLESDGGPATSPVGRVAGDLSR